MKPETKETKIKQQPKKPNKDEIKKLVEEKKKQVKDNQTIRK
jgi:hypothetical protein